MPDEDYEIEFIEERTVADDVKARKKRENESVDSKIEKYAIKSRVVKNKKQAKWLLGSFAFILLLISFVMFAVAYSKRAEREYRQTLPPGSVEVLDRQAEQRNR